MGVPLTYKSRLEQASARKWRLTDNELFMLDNGDIIIGPRNYLTDNNTNPLGDNDLSDVRASHFHDIGCQFHQLIYIKLKQTELIEKGFLKLNKKRSKEEGFDIWVCEDIPPQYIDIRPVGFNEINRIFKEILIGCGTDPALAFWMRFAVNFNIGWIGRKPSIDKELLYKGLIKEKK